MSSLYKRKNSPYYWWTTVYKGRKYSLSTKLTRRDLAKKVADQWDLKFVLGDTSFLPIENQKPDDIQSYIKEYLQFVEKRKSENTLEITRGVLRKFQIFLNGKSIQTLDEITVKIMDNYIDWLDNAPKSKKNYLNVISIMLEQTIKEGLLKSNPAKKATLPQMIINANLHRMLEPIDLDIIFAYSGQWFEYYQFLYHTGLRAGDVALLTHSNIDINKKAIVSFIRKSRRIHEFPIADYLINLLPKNKKKAAPLFPQLYADNEKRLNDKLTAPSGNSDNIRTPFR